MPLKTIKPIMLQEKKNKSDYFDPIQLFKRLFLFFGQKLVIRMLYKVWILNHLTG